ncbi:hypothetical protein ACFOQM_02025 [Paenibacillus sp. GCM10012307]|uniref:Uncharacterized protein n=1 Tax=Paenibacillus roseus TaxID=2798579 RepID=A0A934J3D7_9BACL|nr:hypothetical protein [Paenibacillus roseus]MBJ6360096.1 hypothetical protein [Paenibacillus roseus]
MIDIVVKSKFTVIGKLGQGLATEGSSWVPPLWEEANDKFSEISNLAKLNPDGSIAGWIVSSNSDSFFKGCPAAPHKDTALISRAFFQNGKPTDHFTSS